MSGAAMLGMLVLVFGGSVLLTWLAMAYSRSGSAVDVPNERSLHRVPTPRGGGVAIVVSVMVALLWLYREAMLTAEVVLAIGGGGLAVALIGWIDDHRHVPALWRFAVHAAAAVWALYWLEWLPGINIGVGTWEAGIVGSVLAIVGIVWMTNLYNFMDGIDGIAGVESLTVALAAGLLLALAGAGGMALLMFVVASASAAFLVWNWPPSRIFMGDVGSGFLGFVFATAAIATENDRSLPMLVWIILLTLFICDASYTLLRRILAGDKWYTAHRNHVYQRLVLAGYSHGRVSGSIAVLNLLLLWPLAWIACSYPRSLTGAAVAAVACGSLLWIYWYKETAGNRPSIHVH